MRSRKSIPRLSKALWAALLAMLVVVGFGLDVHAGNWTDDKTKFDSQSREIDELQAQIKQLLDTKRHTDEKADLKRVVDLIAERYKQLQKVSHDREALHLHIRFKHPEQAATLEKRYSRFNLKSLEDMEAEVGIDGRLDRIKAKVMATFPAPELEQEKKDDTKVHPFYRKPASVDEDAVEELKLVK